ncbi:nuclear protein Qri2/Nse4 [Penicillium macrosclerotiorum]|uniref:nuclear protein Qri2/Nse4 n=1 Tax=Penicillium macrosclerotiorum TaxID=303699 RepID=UPI0025482177|nr:nuclear protein Qri2/Nse4 [Penicillium macrosclerotiorum]KAJ5689497.1 nuclear protein Qri2/Nse4 [Penicillium macrosclerotiorum]
MARIPLSQLGQGTSHGSNISTSPRSSSDKENRRQSVTKRTSAQMARTPQASKRRRLTDRTSSIQSQVPSSQRNNGTKFYDPDQPEAERRAVRRGLRDLSSNLNDSHAEFMQSGNDGLYRTVLQANELFTQVKQTSDATLDSRLLVQAADASHKKTAQLALGDSTAGIDIDEFVSKCISYMRSGPDLSEGSAEDTMRGRSRNHRSQRDPNDSDEENHGDAMNWDWLGRSACFPFSARPVVSGWLLGPLSVQKRTRQLTQRTGRERFDQTEAVQPQELRQADLGQQESANLTEICSKINKLLADTQKNAESKVNWILSQEEDPSEERLQEVMDENCIADDGGIPLFRFCVNPRSFGQSVENLFYISFLVRDGHVALNTDTRGLPTLISTAPFAPNEAQRMGIQKHQAIFTLDFDTWRDMIETFNIKECIIPHREEVQEETGQTWYG